MFLKRISFGINLYTFSLVFFLISICFLFGKPVLAATGNSYQNEETGQLVNLVDDAAELIRTKGEDAFKDFRVPDSRWRKGETYIFVVDTEGNMMVNIDASLEGKNQMQLKDINGKLIIKGIIETATTYPDKPAGWYHYEWFVPGDLLPRWKSSYVKVVKAPSGKSYVVGSGMYNDSMERAFVVDEVKDAIKQIDMKGADAFPLFHDPIGRFIVKNSYIFVFDMNGVVLVNSAFPILEGKNLLDMKDTNGKQLIREMINLVQTEGSGWLDYMWPKPGDSVSTQKSAYVSKAKIGDQWVLVGSGVYLADAPRSATVAGKMTATELMNLVREGAAVFEEKGEASYHEFRQKGTKWFNGDTYFFVWDTNGTRLFFAPDPGIEGRNMRDLKDNIGRPIGQMIIDTGTSPSGEGWINYMYPEPGNIFPTWKSTFVKRVTFPSGEKRIIGSGVYNMRMDKAIIEDVVNRAAGLVSANGEKAFDSLRDKQGPFVFMDTYVFVNSPDGTELVNPAQPSLEGKNLMDVKDLKGKTLVKDYITAAMEKGSAWVEYYWYLPGQNTSALKQTFVKKVESGDKTYIVGSGFYPNN